MKKVLLALAIISAIPTSVLARTTQADIDALNNYDVLGEIQQVQRNRQDMHRFKDINFECNFTMTNESTGKIKKNQIYRVGNEITEFKDTKDQYMYLEENDTGSSVVYVDKLNHNAQVTVQDASGQVVSTGQANRCTKL